ncbi:hypothetical protein OBBRIDRAFT_838312 [Obba rivulosa]|uniref:Uncharacterized protein n=1 Tax=Obba rivulosa TaxID=1052685 RepID=A0A8E2DGS8_9APHY|nr:hypothetical protein OBBRIDRAFT_838312 [Obba rivulosa]
MDSSSPRTSQSYIPVLTPRGSLSSPYLGFAPPPSRHLSVSGSPHPSPTNSSGSSSSASSGLASFRSFRSLLSFGPTKSANHPTHHANPSGIPKGPFAGFGSIRRSLTSERSVSAPQLTREGIRHSPPIIAIELPRPNAEPFMDPYEFSAGISSDSKSPKLELPPPDMGLSPHVSDDECAPSFAKGPSDLSTILEAETSGISKHIPSTDVSQEYSGTGAFGVTPDTPSTPALSFHDVENDHGHHSDDGPSHDSSALDLSTSELTHEVYQAISESKDRAGWLAGVVMDSMTDDVPMEEGDSSQSQQIADHDVSLDSETFDEDFASMLRSSQDHTVPHTLLASPFLRSPARKQKTGMHTSVPPSPSRPRVSPIVSPASSSTSHTPSLPPPPPAPKKSSLPRLGHSRLPSSAVPRLTRSASDRPTPQRSHDGAPEPERVARAASHSPERPSPAEASYDRPPLSTPFSRDSWTSSRRSESSTGTDTRRPAPRLFNPTHVSPHLSAARPALRHLATPPYLTREPDLPSPISRPPSSVGTAPSRLQHYRTSLEAGSDRARPASTRHRERSASVTEFRASPDPSFLDRTAAARLTADRVGPRTARALAAAGLLQQDLSGDAAPSRYTPSRLSADRSFRSRHSPSRMAFSEAGSSSSWSRRHGGGSHAMSDAGGPASPHTAFSSTAASVSSAFAAQQRLRAELAQAQERHALETGALLHALADSQRTARVLRDENALLRDRLQELEERLAEAQERLHRMQFAPPAHSTLMNARAAGGRSDRYHSPESSTRLAYTQPRSYLSHLEDAGRPLWQSPGELEIPRADSVLQRSPTIDEHPVLVEEETVRRPAQQSPHRRMSNTSSVFNCPPSTMSMIMHEDDAPIDTSSARSASPSSPTMVYRKIDPDAGFGSPHGYGHSRNTSIGNISPTTANFSMVPGSPGSLNLRPEDEKHLGDIPSFNLGAGFSGYDQYDEHGLS